MAMCASCNPPITPSLTMSREERLLYLAKTYPKDFEVDMVKYKAVCERAKLEPKNFLGDAALIPGDFISVCAYLLISPLNLLSSHKTIVLDAKLSLRLQIETENSLPLIASTSRN
jgi:hypothetical protein